jgi:hypothetical protein
MATLDDVMREFMYTWDQVRVANPGGLSQPDTVLVRADLVAALRNGPTTRAQVMAALAGGRVFTLDEIAEAVTDGRAPAAGNRFVRRTMIRDSLGVPLHWLWREGLIRRTDSNRGRVWLLTERGRNHAASWMSTTTAMQNQVLP